MFGLLQGALVLLNQRCNWLFYIAQMLCLIVFSYLNNLYGDVLSNAIYLGGGIWGWIYWKSEKKVLITRCSMLERIAYVLLMGIGTIILAIGLLQTMDPLPLLDAFTTMSSLVATYYMIKKKIDAWLIWLVNDICYIVQYALLPNQAYYLMLLNVVWTMMALVSFCYWKKIMKGYVK